MSKSNDSLKFTHLPRNQSMPKTTISKALRLPQNMYIHQHQPAPISRACHEKLTLVHHSTRLPLRLPRRVITKSKNAHDTTRRARLRQAPSPGQRFARPGAEKSHSEISERNFSASLRSQNAQLRECALIEPELLHLP